MPGLGGPWVASPWVASGSHVCRGHMADTFLGAPLSGGPLFAPLSPPDPLLEDWVLPGPRGLPRDKQRTGAP